MDIVVDASVLIAVIVGEPQRERLIQLTEGVDLVAPYSVHWEIGNALAAMVKRNRITLGEALMAIEIYEKIPVRYVGIEIGESLKVAGALKLYAYRCLSDSLCGEIPSTLIDAGRRFGNCGATKGNR